MGTGLAASGGEVGNPALNSGVQVGSATVAGLPSSAPICLMAKIGRQKFQWYLSFQVLISGVRRGQIEHREQTRAVAHIE